VDIIIKSGPAPSTTFGTGLTPLIIDPTFGAARIIGKPDEWNNGAGFNGGHYRVAAISGLLTGVAAAGAVYSFRSPPAGLSLLKRVSIGYALTTAFTTGQLLDLDIVRCTGFTASDTGGTALTPFTGNNNKKRSQLMNTSQLADLRISSTAALGAGTKTQDANPFGFVTATPLNLAVPTNLTPGGGLPMTDIYVANENNEHPEAFQNNEGFNIRNMTAMGAAGVIKLYVVVSWVEAPGL
jgi:hypothetical protein